MMAPLMREARRVARAARLVGHVLAGAVVAHAAIALLAQTRLEAAGRWQRTLVRWWVCELCAILNLRIVTRGRINPGATLFVANHISWLDIPCLLAHVDARFVAKREVSSWPAIGSMATQVGTLFLDRGKGNAAAITADRMTWSLQQQRNVIVFPESTTTDGRGVEHFYARLYQAAIRTHRPVQAVAIAYPHRDGVHPRAPFVGDDNLLRHVWALLAEDTVHATLTFCPPLAATVSRRALAERTRAQVRAALSGAPNVGSAEPARRAG